MAHSPRTKSGRRKKYAKICFIKGGGGEDMVVSGHLDFRNLFTYSYDYRFVSRVKDEKRWTGRGEGGNKRWTHGTDTGYVHATEYLI